MRNRAGACFIVRSVSRAGYRCRSGGVPPVGVEPTLGTLLGGRPLPLGYGGWVMIPRAVGTILAQANRGRKIRLGSHIQFMCPGSTNAKRYQSAVIRMNCAHSVAGQWALLGHRS